MICPLCGYTITECSNGTQSTCEKCPFKSKSCNIIRCPNCGYTFADDLPVIKKIKEWFKRKKR